MSAKAADRSLSLWPATAACFALLVRCPARRSRKAGKVPVARELGSAGPHRERGDIPGVLRDCRRFRVHILVSRAENIRRIRPPPLNSTPGFAKPEAHNDIAGSG